jgi:hypothetical protein
MATEAGVRTTNGRPSERADRIGRALMGFNVVATIVAFVNGIAAIANAADDRVFVEIWRTTAYLVFAGLFAVLAARPRAQAGLWELIIAQKVALVVAAVVLGDVAEARLAGSIDFGLVVITVAAYLLCRGWTAWRTGVTEPASDERVPVPAR